MMFGITLLILLLTFVTGIWIRKAVVNYRNNKRILVPVGVAIITFLAAIYVAAYARMDAPGLKITVQDTLYQQRQMERSSRPQLEVTSAPSETLAERTERMLSESRQANEDAKTRFQNLKKDN